jgi:hypothetical protein
MDLQTAIQIAVDTGWLTVWLGFSWFVGGNVLALLGRMDGQRSLHVPNIELQVFLSACAGIAVQIPILIALALAGLLKSVFIGSAALLVLLAAIWQRGGLRVYWPVNSTAKIASTAFWFELLPLLLLIGAWVIRPLGPPIAHDDISYHLPYARFYLEQGGLAVDETLRYPLHTHNYNLLYAVALLRDGTTMAQWVHAASGYLVMLGTWGLARHWFGWLAAVASVVLLLFLGVFTQALGNAYVDLGLTLYFTASMVALVCWFQDRRNAWLFLSAAFLGTALGIKYSAIALSGLLGLVFIWASRNLRQVLLFAGIAFLFGCFWYLRSLVISGNPIHPFASEVFGNYIWTKADINSQWSELGRHGIDKTPLNFILLPWQLIMNPSQFHGSVGLAGWIIGLFYLSLLNFRRWPPILRALSLMSLAYLMFWFGSSQVMRYMMPVLPLLALAVASLPALFLDVLGKRLAARGDTGAELSGAGKIKVLGKLLVIIPVTVFSWNTLHDDWHHLPLPKNAQEEFLSANRAGYELFKVARTHPSIGAGPLLQLQLAADRFYFEGILYGDWFGLYPYREFVKRDQNGQVLLEPLWQRMRAGGMRGFVFAKDAIIGFHAEDLPAFEPWFDLVFSNRYGYLYVPRPELPDREK